MNGPTVATSPAQILTVAGAFFLEVLDATVMLVAILPMASDLSAGISGVTLALATYLLALVVFTPLSSYLLNHLTLADKCQAGLVIFIGGSVACAFSPNLLMLCLARFTQGFGSALIVPAGRALILSHTPKHALANTIAWLITPALTAPMVAPYIAHVMLSVGSWRWIFALIACLAMAVLIACRKYLRALPSPETPAPTLNSYAYAMWVVCSCAIFMVFVFSSNHQLYSAAAAGCVAIVSAATGVIKLRKTTRCHLFDRSLLANPLFRLTVFSGSLFRISIYAFPTVLIIHLMQAPTPHAVSAEHALFFIFAGNFLAKPLAVKGLKNDQHLRRFFICSSCATALTLSLFFIPNLNQAPALLWLACFLHGAARSFQFLGYSTSSVMNLAPNRLHRATILTSSVMQLNALIGQSIPALLAALFIPVHLSDASTLTFFNVGLGTVTALSFITVLTALCLPTSHNRPDPSSPLVD